MAPKPSARRAIERQASAQLTTLTSVLAGFTFNWLVSLARPAEAQFPSQLALVVAAGTLCVLVVASVQRALLTIASGFRERHRPLRRLEFVWATATKAGLVLFLVNAGLLGFHAGVVPALFCSLFAIAAIIVVGVSWRFVKRAVQEEWQQVRGHP
jgi:hypothetical protein